MSDPETEGYQWFQQLNRLTLAGQWMLPAETITINNLLCSAAHRGLVNSKEIGK